MFVVGYTGQEKCRLLYIAFYMPAMCFEAKIWLATSYNSVGISVLYKGRVYIRYTRLYIMLCDAASDTCTGLEYMCASIITWEMTPV